MRWRCLLLLCVVLLVACNKENQQPAPTPDKVESGNANIKERLALLDSTISPQTSIPLELRLLPAQPGAADGLTVQVIGCEDRLSYRWYLNGQQLEQQTAAHLAPGSFRKHDEIQVICQCGARELEAHTTIANTPPQMTTLQLKGPDFGTGIPLVVEAQGQDADGDDLNFNFRWQVDGVDLPWLTVNQLPGDQVHKGQSIQVTAVPSDDEAQGTPLVGEVFVVPNSAPVFTSQPGTGFQSQIYEYQPAVVDPDGDAIVFSLSEAPTGMHIDPVTGLIRCPVAEIQGSAKVTLVATDVDGLQAKQTFSINMN